MSDKTESGHVLAEMLANYTHSAGCSADDPNATEFCSCWRSVAEEALAEPRTESGEALDTCREQRADLLELLEVEREQHCVALAQAWDEGVVAAHRSDLTLFAIKQVNPYRLTTPSGQEA